MLSHANKLPDSKMGTHTSAQFAIQVSAMFKFNPLSGKPAIRPALKKLIYFKIKTIYALKSALFQIGFKVVNNLANTAGDRRHTLSARNVNCIYVIPVARIVGKTRPSMIFFVISVSEPLDLLFSLLYEI